jgi:hypothetical protein
MKTKLYLCALLFLIGLADVIYWFYYWNLNEKLALSDYSKFIANYYNSFPPFLKSFYTSNLSTIVFFLVFFISGLTFWISKRFFFRILAIVAFILSFLELFSLM